jgi:hypothetical protein
MVFHVYLSRSHYKILVIYFQSLQIRYTWVPFDPAVPLLGIYPKDCDTGYSRDPCTPMFIAALFTIAKLWKQPRCPSTDEWIKKMWYLYTWNFMQP